MDRRTTLCMILAGAIGAYTNDIGSVFRIANDARECFRTSKERDHTSEAGEGEPRSLYRKTQPAKHPTPETLPDLEYITERIEEVVWVYSSEKARETLHSGLSRVMGDIPRSDDPWVRVEIMRHLQDTFYSSAFGLGDPEYIGGRRFGDAVMDEDRADRIYQHSLSFHGQGIYVTGDVCLKRFVDEDAKARAREENRCRTWGDAAEKYLGARPARECRGLSAEQRAIGRYRGRR